MTSPPNAFLDRLRAAMRGSAPLVVAHRGDSSHAPENTIDAAEAAHAGGADAWELDVQLTRDGVAVVMHDDSLARTTDVATRFAGDPRGRAGWMVADFTLAEIESLDAGRWFIGPEGGPRSSRAFGTLATLGRDALARFSSGRVRVPTLAEALERTSQLDWLVNVELKSVPGAEPGLLDAALREVDATGTASRVLISSFDHAEVARLARMRRDVGSAVLTMTPLHRPASYVRDRVGADAYHASLDAVGAGSVAYRRSPAPGALRGLDFAELRELGVPWSVFTVNDIAAGGIAGHLASSGVAGFFGDDPIGLASCLHQSILSRHHDPDG